MPQEDLKTTPRSAGAVQLVLLADVFFTCMDGTVQLLEARGLSPLQVAFLRLVSPAVLDRVYVADLGR